jgi:GT2 family glycosyltransferase/tetratricopeptide (TPR) repeat protein
VFLQEVRAWPGPARVAVIRNEINRGFPAGCNQGLALTRGRYVVFLNNDTVVTAGWLDGLLAAMRRGGPDTGFVGAVTNYSRPPQQIAVDYAGIDGLDGFAARRRQEFAGQVTVVERLTGFCLLARRELFDRIGDFDERFGLGFFDDDDLCVRARGAGFDLLVAQDVFVHHFGSRTFTTLGIDCQAQLQSNFQRFQAKWGAEHSAGYRLPGAVGDPEPGAPSQETASSLEFTVAVREPLRGAVSLCMIVKDEETHLPECLDSVRDLVQEIVVVDTGSTDDTRAVAGRYGARVVDFPWVDSFAAARNESLRHARCPWVFWMDADDRLDADNHCKLRDLFGRLPDGNVAYVMKCLCLADPNHEGATVVDHVRLFRNHPEIRWTYRVHEQILPAVRRLNGEVCWTDVVIRHVGYQDPALRGRKLERDLRLLQLEDAEHPDDPFTLFNLGATFQELGRPDQALPLLRRSLERSDPSASIIRKLYALMVQCHRQLGQNEAALVACRAGRALCPEDAELLFQEGVILRTRRDLAGAEACFRRLLQEREGDHFASVDSGLRGYKARHNLAAILQEQGRVAEAEAMWQAALEEQPGFVPGWLGLGELFLAQTRWEELNEVSRQLRAIPQAAIEAEVLCARGHLARQEFAAARQLLEQAIPQAPQQIWPRVILSHVLLQEGQDWSAAEEALRSVLTLDPNHAEARRNLAVLLRQRGCA